MSATPVAFVGLGLMGRPMAFHLRSKDHPLRVYNRTAGKTLGFAEKGATVCATPAEAAQGSKIVFLCVGDGPDVEQVILGKDGIAETAAPGTLVVDHSTISPQATQEIGAKLKEKDLRFLDAPISGGMWGAIEGRLAIMCGGEPKDFDEAKPVMEAYGKKITLVGPLGMGQVTKACNQVLVVASILGTAEALNLARRLGADPAKVIEAVKDGAAGSWTLNNLGPKMAAGDDAAGFFVKHQVKDLRIVLESARACGAPVPGTALIHELYKAVLGRGGGECGNQTLIRALQVLGGEEWTAPKQQE